MSDKPTNDPTAFSPKARSLSEEIFDTVREPMLVLDKNLRVKKASTPFYEHFRVSPEETLDRSVYELGNNQWDIPDLRTLLEEILPSDMVFNDFEVRHEFEEIGERIMLLNARRIDQLQLILLAIEDITEKKKAEQVLAVRAEEFREMADAMPHLVWRAQPDGTVDYCNERHQEFRGVEQREDGTWKWQSTVHPHDEKRTVQAWLSALQDGKTYQVEHRLQCQNGAYRWFLSRAKPVKDDGHIKAWYGTATDIEDMKQAEREIAEAKQKAEAATVAKSEFLANMSHEIRTPMTIFLGALEHLEQIDSNPDHQKLLQMADKSARHLRELIDDILDFSRIEAGQIDIHESPFDVRAWLKDAVGMFQPLARKKNLRLTCSVADQVPVLIEADATRLKQILNNLLGNAIKFTVRGEVEVTVKATNESLAFGVADTGIGIPEDKQHLLFQNFSQINSSFQKDYGGTGLGLAISKKLANLMDGQISVWSREGEGSLFTLSIPLKVPTETGQEFPAKNLAVPGDALPHRILLVEDDPMIRELFLMGLQQRGAHADIAESGEEALRMWSQSSFDVILMDLQMPGMDGLEATRRIRAKETEGDEHVCIIGVTAYARRKIIEECFKAGMDEVLTKPLKTRDLEEAILRCATK